MSKKEDRLNRLARRAEHLEKRIAEGQVSGKDLTWDKGEASAIRFALKYIETIETDLAAAREDVARMDWLEITVKDWLYHADISIQSDEEDGVWVTRLYRERQGKQGLAFDSSEAKTETVRAAIDSARAGGGNGLAAQPPASGVTDGELLDLLGSLGDNGEVVIDGDLEGERVVLSWNAWGDVKTPREALAALRAGRGGK